MANEEHIDIVKQGANAIDVFRKQHPEVKLDLGGADLSYLDLSHADLSQGSLTGTNLTGAYLDYTSLNRSGLVDTVFSGCSAKCLSLKEASISGCMFTQMDLSKACDLESVYIWGPSYLDTHTLRASRGQIPESFLRGIGFSPWEVLNAKLYDPLLNVDQLAEIHDAMFKKLIGSPVGGIFVSYSHADIEFVERLCFALSKEGYPVWRDEHDLVAGPLERQVFDAIRINNVVLLVLSKDSVKSDWVEAELAKAREKEKSEGRPVLCPITIDTDWESKLPEDAQEILWRTVKKKVVLDFCSGFDDGFTKLLKGLPRYYGIVEGAGAEGVATD